MKIIKRLSIFLLLVVLFGACFDSPDFSIVPKISINDVRVKITPDRAVADTLTVVLNFEDGDGDLGLDPSNPDHSSKPYHYRTYFVEGNGELLPITTRIFNQNVPILLDVPDGVTGAIATNLTRNKPGFEDENLPPNEFPYTCTNYSYETIYFLESGRHIFDQTYVVRDTLGVKKTTGTFYYERNLNHYNFNIDILVKSPNDPKADGEGFVVFDWIRGTCAEDLYSRFPVLTDVKRPLQGTLRYQRATPGLQNLFTGKRIKIQVSILDRALHKSNTVRSKEFAI